MASCISPVTRRTPGVQLWSSYNRHLAHVIAAIPEDAGSTLEFLVADYVRHLEHHLEQLLG
jgi:hypothetical protein